VRGSETDVVGEARFSLWPPWVGPPAVFALLLLACASRVPRSRRRKSGFPASAMVSCGFESLLSHLGGLERASIRAGRHAHGCSDSTLVRASKSEELGGETDRPRDKALLPDLQRGRPSAGQVSTWVSITRVLHGRSPDPPKREGSTSQWLPDFMTPSVKPWDPLAFGPSGFDPTPGTMSSLSCPKVEWSRSEEWEASRRGRGVRDPGVGRLVQQQLASERGADHLSVGERTDRALSRVTPSNNLW